MQRELMDPGMQSLGAQLAVLPPLAQVIAGPCMLAMGVAAVAMQPANLFAWLLLALAWMLGGPLLGRGVIELREQRIERAELERAKAELAELRADVAAAVQDKRGVDWFLLQRGYMSAKVRRWIALECDIVLPRGPG